MMMAVTDNLTDIGVGGIIVVLVLNAVFKFLSDRKTNGNGLDSNVTKYQINQIHKVQEEMRQEIGKALNQIAINGKDTVNILKRLEQKHP